ncbi:DMT family transporter [Kocuria coralli]|uniref:DMT family transporter n=1 Tax=Kocuria coralli TaxID=1461025 RepID=A0A5J5KTN2_9MICC|nr:DMT family transporter [Kocuria coralli]KAA9392954.1 DMT family transporter [Kocuria coralli]
MQQSSARNTLAGVGLVIGSCISLQFGAAVAVQLFPHLGAWGVTTLRLGIAAVILLVLVRPQVRTWTRKQWTAVVLFGAALGCMNGFFYASLERIPLGAAVSIEFLGPLVLAAVMARRLLDGLWVALALGGMALLGLDSALGTPLDPVGVVLALVAGVFWAGYVLTSARVGQLVPGAGGLAAALVVAALVVAPFGAPGAIGAFNDPVLLGLALVTALLASVIPYTLELSALRRLPAPVFSILLSLEPAFAALFGWILLGQESGVLRNLAIALVILASLGVTLTNPRRQTSEKPTGARRHGGHHPAGGSEPVEAVPAGFRQSATETEGWGHTIP